MNKALKIVGYFLLVFTLILIIIGILFNVYFNKKVIENLKEQVAESTNNEYRLSLDGLTINLLSRSVTIKNLIIAPLKKNESNKKPQYLFKAKVFKIIDFSILSYFRHHDLIIDRVEFEEPHISIFQGSERRPKKDLAPGETNISFYSSFSKKLNSIAIGHIEIMNSKFNVYKSGIDTLSVFATNDNSISIKNFSINADTDKKNRLFVAEKFEIVLNKFSYHLGNGLYSLYGKSLYASYIDSTLIIDSLKLLPNFSKKEFADEAGFQTTRVKIISDKVNCKRTDVKLFFEYNSLVIGKVELIGVTIDAFRDNTLPLRKIIRPSLQAMIKNLPIFIAVDTVEMKNCEIDFEVRNPGTLTTGKLEVNKMNAIITGIQNDTSIYTDDQSIKAEVNGYVFNQGKFKESYTFPLKATSEHFYCSGSMTGMPMSAFNPIIEQAKNVSIKSGQLDSVSFSFVAHQNTSEGKMKFMYHDLNVEIMNKDGGKMRFKEKLKTLVANKLIIMDSNPGKNGVVRISNIHANHNPYRFFLNYSMQSVLSGIAPAIQSEKMTKRLKKKK